MASRDWLDPDIVSYIEAHATPPDEVLRALHDETTAALESASRMQVSADEGALLGLLTGLVGASYAVEVGTFTGYSSICIARALRPGGRLLCCDVSEEYTAYARRAWAAAGLEDRIELRIGPAIDTLKTLATEPEIDLAFIDADKVGYRSYYDELLPRMRPGGLMLADNTLWSAKVLDETVTDDDTVALRAFNDAIAADPRVESFILPIRDGLTLIRVR